MLLESSSDELPGSRCCETVNWARTPAAGLAERAARIASASGRSGGWLLPRVIAYAVTVSAAAITTASASQPPTRAVDVVPLPMMLTTSQCGRGQASYGL